MRIALAQFAAGPSKEANLGRMLALAELAAAARADLVLFPECSMIHLPDGENPAPAAEPLDGPFAAALGAAARRHGVALVAGMFEQAPVPERAYNTVVALDRTGSLIGAYRKIHLYDAFGFRESDHIVAGSGDTLVFTLEGVTFGVQTCYDVRFPELSHHLAGRGAEVLLLPAAWVHGLLKESHWEVLVRARAIENTTYVAAAGLTGRPFTGSSMLVDPMGVPVARAAETEALVAGEVDPERVAAVRRTNPSLANARPDVYERWAPAPAVRA